MFDTINFRLGLDLLPNMDFLAEISNYIDDVSEHYYGDCLYLIGSLGNLKISVSNWQIKVKDGSLCKWYLGNNINSLTRKDTQLAIEKLSDTLHLPMERAEVTRLDVSSNFITKHPTDVYLNHLGTLSYSKRLQQPCGLYYQYKDGTLCFYDKMKELKAKGECVPILFQDKNLLRYEQRHTHRIAHNLGVASFKASNLYDEVFYMKLLNGWAEKFKEIHKINDISLNFETMKTKQDLYRMGVLSLIEQRGGEMAILGEIAEAQKMGNLTRKQAYDLRIAICNACKEKQSLTIPNDAVKELERKVIDTIKFYR